MAKKNSDNEKSTSGGIKKFLVIVLALLVLDAGGFGGYYYYMKSTSDVEKPIVEEKIPVAEDIMVRLADESGKSYLKATINISYDKRNKKVGKELNSKLTEVKDATLFYLMSKKSEDFRAENEENLKKGLIEDINKILDEGKIVNIYFDQLLAQ